MKKRMLALFLTIAMLLTLAPAVLAADAGAEVENEQQTVLAANEPEVQIALKAGSKIKLWERLDGGNADPENVGEYFNGKPVEYDGWQLMKLVVTIPAQDGLTVTGVTPGTPSLYPELSKVEQTDDGYTYSYYFKQNGTYTFDISYKMNDVQGKKHEEYKVNDLVYIPDVTMRAYFLLLADINEYRGYVTETDIREGRIYSSETEYKTDDDMGIFTSGYNPGSEGLGLYLQEVKNLEGIQYMNTMHQIQFYGKSGSGDFNKQMAAESLEPMTRGWYPKMSMFQFTAPLNPETVVPPNAYTSEMLAEILTKMPNLTEFDARRTGFKNFEAFGQMNGKMQVIDCAYNHVTSLEGLEKHTGLTHLSMNRNEITDLSPLANVTNAYSWNFIQNNISDLTPIHNVKVSRVIHFGFQSVYPEPVFASAKEDHYELELPMPIDIDGSATKVGFANWLASQIESQVPVEQRDKLLVKYAEGNVKLYPVTERDGKVYVEIPKADVPNAGTDQAFEGSVMRFWFENDSGSDSRTRGNFNGKVDFTATPVEKPTTCTVSYVFQSKDNALTLPEAVMAQLPEAQIVNLGETVTIPADLKLNAVETADGVWNFVGWDKTQIDNIASDDSFVGTWEFVENAFELNAAPVLTVSDSTLTAGDHFDVMHGVTAADREDGDLTSKVEVLKNTVDTTKAGNYEVTYRVTDSKGASATKTVKVTVKNAPYVPPVRPNRPDPKPESHVPGMLNGEDHFAYVNGYEDGTVRPNANITRAEVASIFFRLLKDDVRDRNMTTVNAFADSSAGDWYNTAVSTMTSLGILKGRTADTFAPNAPITRAEFAAIAARFDTSNVTVRGTFTDVSDHWARMEIERAAALGWIKGYEDGSFHPDAPITRAEAMTIVNRVLERLPESERDLLLGMRTWSDNPVGSWFYLAVQEATNSHTYTHTDRVPHETWKTLTPDPDWSRYE